MMIIVMGMIVVVLILIAIMTIVAAIIPTVTTIIVIMITKTTDNNTIICRQKNISTRDIPALFHQRKRTLDPRLIYMKAKGFSRLPRSKANFKITLILPTPGPCRWLRASRTWEPAVISVWCVWHIYSVCVYTVDRMVILSFGKIDFYLCIYLFILR